jgi:hypothetical protein
VGAPDRTSPSAGADGLALGGLLALLHCVDPPLEAVEVSYRIWRHRPRANAAFVAHAEARRQRGASITTYGRGRREPEPDEVEETLRIWRAGERARVEHHGGERDGYYAVTDGPLWWVWDERMGARSNRDDPTVGGSFGGELEIMLNPVALLSSLRLEPAGSSEVAGRPTVTARGTPRPEDPRGRGAFELYELGTGADHYELEVDRQLGVLLAVTAIRDGGPFQQITTLAFASGQPIPDDVFRFEPPPGEQIESIHDDHRVEYVTLAEAQQETPFTVLMPDTVPASWQVQCRLIKASRRPPSPPQIGLSYTSVDGHESVSLSQTAAGPCNPYSHMADDEDWETVIRGGVEMRTRPARWGQAQVELEREGTFVHLMSDNLTRDQLVRIASGLRPAPSTSGI